MLLEEKITELIGGENIISRSNGKMDELTFNSYGIDRTKLHKPDFEYLLFPRSTRDVSKILTFAFENNISIVPSGGRTGYAGGAIAKEKEMVVSLSKMDRVLDFDPFLGALSVEAGMITQNLHRIAEEHGLQFPVDFAATGSSHIGGNIATNAGGVRVIRYGLIRNWILGMKVVIGTGEVLEFNGNILKNNTGYDLKHLFMGSEGTLGIITEVTVKLTNIPKDTNVVLFATDEFNKILEIFKICNRSPLPVMAFEFFTERCLEKVVSHLHVNKPFESSHAYYILVEFEMREETDNTHLETLLNEIFSEELIHDGSIAQNSTQKKTFWKYREGISESLSILHTVHKNDISLPLREMKPFLESMESLLADKYPGFEIALFGHIGDGNLHLNILKPKDMQDETFFSACKKVDPDMFGLIQKFNGSISAEHGIGLLKKEFLGYSRSGIEIELMKNIKKVFDPKGILNPGKLF